MAKTLTQKIVFKNASPETLYEMFLNAKHHAAITGGGTTKIIAKEGEQFSVYDGYITGKNLQLVRGKLIVQSWFGSDWNANEPDSTFILLFEQKGKDTLLNMIHANIPDEFAEGIKKGWTDFYWKPWKKYLSSIK